MFKDCELLAGFYSREQDGVGAFVWTSETFQFRLNRAAPFARLRLCYYGDEGVLRVRAADGAVDELPLGHGWHDCGVPLRAPNGGQTVGFQVAPLIAVPGESRRLGVMLREVELFDDARRFEMLARTAANLRLSRHEYLAGQSVLASVPPELRISMEVRCNIPETSQACVYCSWDWAKRLEQGAPAFTLDTLEQLGDFYRCATYINDCSYGEPAMNKDFGPIVTRIDEDGKQFALTSNGQLLTARRRRELLGKNVSVYVSIDSATAAGYARYRNDRFDDLIANVTALCREKKQHHDLPRVYASFIAMRSNVCELPQYFALMREVGVDEIKLRALYLDELLPHSTLNNGYRFDYARELLSMSELAAVARQAEELSREHGVSVYREWEQFVTDARGQHGPLCSEPWKTMYAMGRGIMPCCYATEPIATWAQQQGRPLETFLKEVFNGPVFQQIRAELAQGRLHDYCLNTPSCPILKQMQAEGRAVAPLNAFQRQVFGDMADRGAALPMVPLESLSKNNRGAA